MNLFKDLAPAIKKETKRVGIFTFSGVVVMWLVFVILHACMPEKVPFDYSVIVGGFLGGLIAPEFLPHGRHRTEGCLRGK